MFGWTASAYNPIVVLDPYRIPLAEAVGQWAPAVPPYLLRCDPLSPGRELHGVNEGSSFQHPQGSRPF